MVKIVSFRIKVFKNTFLFYLCIFGVSEDLVLWGIEVLDGISLSPLGRLCHSMSHLCLAYLLIQERPLFCLELA